jgi:DNA-binding MarR family transcriptional regulator
MQTYPSHGGPGDALSREAVQHRVQRWLLLELVTAPPAEGDGIAQLAAGLKEERVDVEAAIDALVRAGLAVREGDRARATVAALRFDELWPVRT